MFESEPYAIESSEFVKPGKGQAFARVKMRRLLTGSRVEKTFKSTDSCEGADVKVPLFVQIGEVVRVDTRSGEYVSRVK